MIGYLVFSQVYWGLVCKGAESRIKEARYTPYAGESKDLKEEKVGDRSTGWGVGYKKLSYYHYSVDSIGVSSLIVTAESKINNIIDQLEDVRRIDK